MSTLVVSPTGVTVVPAPTILPPGPAPATTAKPQDFLQKLGSWFHNKFVPVAKVVEHDAIVVAQAAEPAIDIAFPAVAGIYNTTVQMVVAAEAAAAGAQGVGAQKLSSVVSQLLPIAIPYLKSIGISDPTAIQVQAYVQSVVDGLKIFTALTTQPALPAPTPTPAP